MSPADSNPVSPSTLLEVENLRTWFNTPRGVLRAVDGVSLTLNRGATLGVVGESGSGKSVLAKSIMNLLPDNAVIPRGGSVRFNGRNVRALNSWEAQHFWGKEIAMVFQDPMTSLNPVKKVGVQLTESMRFHLGLNKRQATERALDLMNQVRIPEPRRRLDQYPHELSGGMRQRITIAIAVSCEPRLLVADEPTTALDVTVQRQILELLSQLQQELHMAMILITHDLGVVAGHADRVAVMYAGQIVDIAGTAELFDNMQHPYTEGLLNSIPRLTAESHAMLESIPGRPPDMVHPPAGCRFAPRCRYAQPKCIDEPPPLAGEPGLSHAYRCWFPVGTIEGEQALAANRVVGENAAGVSVATVGTA